MPVTALQRFQEDMARAKVIVVHADPLPHATDTQRLLRSDFLRAGWMFAVGALDAYFCDAYTDLVAATANSKSRQPTITLPEWVFDIKFPLRAVLEDYDNENWKWRMAARKMMERESVISKVIQDVEFLVKRCDEHIITEFRHFLAGVGCSAATIAQAGY